MKRIRYRNNLRNYQLQNKIKEHLKRMTDGKIPKEAMNYKPRLNAGRSKEMLINQNFRERTG